MKNHLVIGLSMVALAGGCGVESPSPDATEARDVRVQPGAPRPDGPGPFVDGKPASSGTDPRNFGDGGNNVYCDYNNPSGSGGVYMPGDTSTDLICVQDVYLFSAPPIPTEWSYSSSDGRLNSWGWFTSGPAVNWGMCLNPGGSAPSYYLYVGMRYSGVGEWYVNAAIPCKSPSWW